MNRKLYYLPVEKYSSRWTQYVSNVDGMFAHCVQDADRNIELITVAPDNEVKHITSGVVLDTLTRTEWSFWQIKELITLIEAGEITSNSVIYIEDFWTGGMEMLPYACHLKGIKPRVYAFWHAQSVNVDDFTYNMLPWIRDFEIGFASWLTGIFVAAKELKQMMLFPEDGRPICEAEKIHVVGTVYRRETMLNMFYQGNVSRMPRRKSVLFTSRFNPEKCPEIFIALAKYSKSKKQDWVFEVLSGRNISDYWMGECKNAGIPVHDNCTKKFYVTLLSDSCVMFNCAKQDFVGYNQGDALAYGCVILCPNYLTFPELLQNDQKYLYQPGNVEDAYQKLCVLINEQSKKTVMQIGEIPALYTRFFEKYEHSVARMLDIMFGV